MKPRRPKILMLVAGLSFLPPCRAQAPSNDFPGGRSSFPEGAGPRQLDALPLFFPPSPPPLGRPIGRAPAPPSRNIAPAELAAYINEPFYPPLGTRLATKSLTEKLRHQLEAYRATKVALQNELRAELTRIHSLEPETRATELAALSRRQTPKIAELEKSAEQLRRDLISSDNHWSALRQWRLGDRERRGYSPIEIGQVMRGYAYYHHGLLPAQRRLLREIFLELANAADNTETATMAQPYMFFPPEPARVLLPDDLPADIAAKVAAYQTQKSRLKKELYDAVYAEDGKVLPFLRGNSLKALAEKHAAPIARLEALAEEIRRGLGEMGDPTKIAERSPLPPVLHQRVGALATNYTQLQKETAMRMEALLAEFRSAALRTSYRFDADSLKFEVYPARSRGGPSAETLARANELRARITVIADEYARRVVEHINEKEAIRVEIAALGMKGTAIDNALAAAVRVITARETADSYREYRIAVFQPGLSPEQRRLLFDSVMERFEMPLPRGENQPTFRASSW